MFGSSAAAKTFTSLILHFKAINPSGCHNGNQEFKCLGNGGVASSRLGGAATAQHHLRGPYSRQRPLHENHPVFVTSELKQKARDHFHGLPGGLGKPPGFEYNDPHKTESGAESAAANEDNSFGNWRNHDFQSASCWAASAS